MGVGPFLIFFAVLIVQRLLELRVANRNAAWMQAQGGYEVGKSHYKYIVFIHVGFLLSLLFEVTVGGARVPAWWPLPMLILLAAQVLRYWCIMSLGRFWNTRIYILPGSTLLRTGPYRWLPHPNYLIVITEILVIPLIFGAYWTAAIWSVINLAFLLMVRIPIEEQALHTLKE